MSRLLCAALILFLSTTIKAQNVNINCNFVFVVNVYTCQISGLTVSSNENANFIIGGQHLAGQNNANVGRVDITGSNIPFVIRQFFTTFPNLASFHVLSSGLIRIQTSAFENAGNLRTIGINGNPTTTIAANAFTGASNVTLLDMLGNQISDIHELAFNGLTSLQAIFGDHNRIQQLHHNVFRPLTTLDSLYLSNNELESLDGRILANNNNIIRLDIARNRINALGRTFLDGIPRLAAFNTVGNTCTNSYWRIGGVITMETVRVGLSTCFDNFVEPPSDDVRFLTLELTGTLIIRDENGTEIIRL